MSNMQVWRDATNKIHFAVNHLLYAVQYYQAVEMAQAEAQAFNDYAREQRQLTEPRAPLRIRVHGAINTLASVRFPVIVQDTRMLLGYTYELVGNLVMVAHAEAIGEAAESELTQASNWCLEAHGAAIEAVAVVRALFENPPGDVQEDEDNPIEAARTTVQSAVNKCSARVYWIEVAMKLSGHAPAGEQTGM